MTNTTGFNTEQATINRDIAINTCESSNIANVIVARRIANELAVNGPISTDDIMQELTKQGFKFGSRSRKWLGAVFQKSEWQSVASVQSRRVSNHARYIRLWARKTWLYEHPTNGTAYDNSAFNLAKIFRQSNNSSDINSSKVWIIGTDKLEKQTLSTINNNHQLYGIDVILTPGTGAVLVKKEVLSKLPGGELSREIKDKINNIKTIINSIGD